MTTKVDSRLNSYSPAVLSLFRLLFGFLFTAFGTSKLSDWPIAFHIPTGSWSLWYAGVIELVTGLLIMFGLFTRIAAFIASGHMAVAYLWQHLPHGLWPIVGPEMAATAACQRSCFASASFCWSSPDGAHLRWTRC
jgi:putative oxidoreductase